MSQEGLLEAIDKAIADSSLVVVCGAGTSLAATRNDARAGWRGFIDHALGWSERNRITFDGMDGIARARSDLESRDFISAADKVQRALEIAGEWTRFLTETFQELELQDARLLEAIGALGCPIATTNYDTLIEAALRIPSIRWGSPSFTQALRRQTVGVAHMHGVWTEPTSVVFGSYSYGRLTSAEPFRTLETAMGLRSSMLFVGVGDGIEDPNLGQLIHYLDTHFRDAGITHYRLVTNRDLGSVPRTSVVKPVVFGDDPSTDLLAFIESMGMRNPRGAGRRSRALVGQDPTELLATPLLRALGEPGPTLGQLWPDLIIDLHVRPLRDLVPSDVPFSEWLARAHIQRRLAVVGQPGAGKSTTLRRLVLMSESAGLPECAFVSAHDLCKVDSIEDVSEPVLVIDAIDELGVGEIDKVVDLLESAPSRPWWLSCRTEFFGRESPARSLLESAGQVLEVRPLKPESIDRFIAEYVRRTGARDVEERLGRWRENAKFADLLTVPLNLTLAVFLASGRRPAEQPQQPPTSRFDLYQAFYGHWLDYEVRRAEFGSSERRRIRERHVAFARNIYLRRQGRSNKGLTLDADASHPWRDVATLLLQTRDSAGHRFVDRFLHDTYMEFLLASDVLDSFIRGSRRRLRLDIAFNDDVNGFIRDGIAGLDIDEREGVLERLTSLYQESDDQREREHALYYIGRLELPSCPAILVKAYELETNPLSRRAAALGAILHGNEEIELDFMTTLLSSTEEEARNRSVQMVYFGDGRGDLHQFHDDGTAPWIRTRRAIFERLTAIDERSERLRWWDVSTIHSFFSCRNDMPTEHEIALLNVVDDRYSVGVSPRDLAITKVTESLAGRTL
jgi:hypothetical protein